MLLKMREGGHLGRVVLPVWLFALSGIAVPVFAGESPATRVSESALEAALPSAIDEPDSVRRSAEVTPEAPSDVDIESFFFEHPELFERRRLYVLREFTVVVTDTAKSAALRAKLYRVQTSKTFERTIAQSGFKYQVGKQVTMGAESLPLTVVGPLSKVEPGEAMFVTARDGFKALFVVAARYSPVSLDQARPAIAQFLTNTRSRDAKARSSANAAGS